MKKEEIERMKELVSVPTQSDWWYSLTIGGVGLGLSYELACQLMLWRLYDMCKNMEFNTIEQLDEYVTDSDVVKRVNPSGAMYSAVVFHLYYILKYGYEEWLSEGKKYDRNIITTIDKKLLDVFEKYYIGEKGSD